MSARRTVCAWGAFAALLLGGCMLDTTGPDVDEGPLGSDAQELVPGERALPAPLDTDEGEVGDEAEDEQDDPAGPEQDVVPDVGPGEWTDPSPDPWMQVARAPRGTSPDR